jgi:ribosomal protein S18 acetylase RimI-like enzyme
MGGQHRRNDLDVVEELPPDRAEEAVAVLCDAFHQYPAMRYIIGSAGDRYSRRLHTLIGFFVAARVWRKEPILAVTDSDQAVAVAILTAPDQREPPATLAEHREKVWDELGVEARRRYESLGRVWQQFTVLDPHYHLNLIGVHQSHSGRGLGRRLLDAVHEMSLREPGSCGVSLTTEDQSNVALYQHFGYEVLGHVRVSRELETWGMFRGDGDTAQR